MDNSGREKLNAGSSGEQRESNKIDVQHLGVLIGGGLPARPWREGQHGRWQRLGTLTLAGVPPSSSQHGCLVRVRGDLEREPVEKRRVDVDRGQGVRSDGQDDDADSGVGVAA